jgi:uncharacterized membrane protein
VVEYALLIVGSALGPLAAQVSQFMAGLDWHLLGYLGLALLALRIAFWAFKVTV